MISMIEREHSSAYAALNPPFPPEPRKTPRDADSVPGQCRHVADGRTPQRGCKRGDGRRVKESAPWRNGARIGK